MRAPPLTLLGLLVLEPLLVLLRTPDRVAVYAAEYLRIIFLGFPAAFAYNLVSGVLRAVGNTRAALFFLSLSMGVNLILDLVFVAGLSMGVAGAVWLVGMAGAVLFMASFGLPVSLLVGGLISSRNSL